MPLFYRDVPPNKNNIFHHPWEITIKDKNANKMIYSHNSINNPEYPKQKQKEPDKGRIKFTVIGNRVTKEFIYAMYMVKGLHKYRRKNFGAPVIRGVTTVEWSNVWRDLKIQHGGLAYCLQSQVAVLVNDKFLGGEKELEELIKTKYIYPLYLNYYEESVAQFANFVRSSGRPCAYMHFSVNSEHIGTMIFILYSDIVPYTCENFLRLCKTKKGGYSGTPVHRIVKDGWIQCGGYGLKDSELDCENFTVPLDRRGVLGMANADRHVNCSTQFFVLLQPAPWMAQKYVAFGQLIEGEETLRKIENVPTWYESPTSEIIIYQAGIFNMECQDIRISKGTREYINSHIEDLITLKELLYEIIIERVFLEVDIRRVKQLEPFGEAVGEEETGSIRATKRFIRNKEDIEKQLENSDVDDRRDTFEDQAENNEFDVEIYEYEPEELSYQQHVPPVAVASLVVKPEKLFYLPLTDVLYPGEVDSTYDLKKFLRGDYCLESDLQKDASKKLAQRDRALFSSDLFSLMEDESEHNSEGSLDSDEEMEIQKYLKLNVDRVSFAGSIVKGIAKSYAKLNIFEDARRSELITDEQLRRFRLASIDYKTRESRNKKVFISEPFSVKTEHAKIKRRQTGFIRPEDLENINIVKESSSELLTEEQNDANVTVPRKVRIAPSVVAAPKESHSSRRPTGLDRPSNIVDSDADVQRQSVLTRLYDDLTLKDEIQGPTLKDYKPMSETQQKHLMLLTFSPNSRIKSEENTHDQYIRQSMNVGDGSYEHVLNLQHGRKITQKISSDYVKTIDQFQQRLQNSIRSVEFAKVRPSISVSEYQIKNQIYKEGLMNASKPQLETEIKSVTDFSIQKPVGGLRLPGDTPLYSLSDNED